MVKIYDPVLIDKDGAFRVNGGCARSEELAIRNCKAHIDRGSKLHYMDSFYIEDEKADGIR